MEWNFTCDGVSGLSRSRGVDFCNLQSVEQWIHKAGRGRPTPLLTRKYQVEHSLGIPRRPYRRILHIASRSWIRGYNVEIYTQPAFVLKTHSRSSRPVPLHGQSR